MWSFFAWLGGVTFVYHVVHLILISLFDGDAKVILAELFGKSAETLKGKVIWITGASSGIGENLAMECAKNGAKLVLSARRRNDLERVKSECLRLSSGKLSEDDILVLPLDITNIDEQQKLFDEVIKHFGRLDILVNNAGRSQRALWENIDVKVDREIFELNVFGMIHLSRIAVKYFLQRGSGHIAVTSSGAGVMGVPFSGSYTASKHAVHGYYNSLRSEKSDKNLTVTVFCPGPTFSNFLQESFTGTPNEKFGANVQQNDRRMTGERCAQLFAIALANKLDEVWVAVSPIIPLLYANAYYPNVIKLVMKIIGPKRLLKLRDSRVSMKIDQVNTK